jgi:hypothetical protein
MSLVKAVRLPVRYHRTNFSEISQWGHFSKKKSIISNLDKIVEKFGHFAFRLMYVHHESIFV